MRPAQPIRELLVVRRAFGGDAEFGISGAHRFDIVLAALLDDLQPVEQGARQHRDRGGGDFAEHGGAEAAPNDEQAKAAIRGQRRETVCADRDALVAHRIAGDKFLERSEEHTSELQSLMRISYAVFCLKKKKKK